MGEENAGLSELVSELVEAAFQALDADNDHRLSFEEFRGWEMARTESHQQMHTLLVCANDALLAITPEQLKVLLGYKNPPGVVAMVLASVRILMGTDGSTPADLSWQASQRWLAHLKPTILEALLTMNKDSLPVETVDALQPYISLELYTEEKLMAVCPACAGLATFVSSVCAWYGHAHVLLSATVPNSERREQGSNARKRKREKKKKKREEKRRKRDEARAIAGRASPAETPTKTVDTHDNASDETQEVELEATVAQVDEEGEKQDGRTKEQASDVVEETTAAEINPEDEPQLELTKKQQEAVVKLGESRQSVLRALKGIRREHLKALAGVLGKHGRRASDKLLVVLQAVHVVITPNGYVPAMHEDGETDEGATSKNQSGNDSSPGVGVYRSMLSRASHLLQTLKRVSTSGLDTLAPTGMKAARVYEDTLVALAPESRKRGGKKNGGKGVEEVESLRIWVLQVLAYHKLRLNLIKTGTISEQTVALHSRQLSKTRRDAKQKKRQQKQAKVTQPRDRDEAADEDAVFGTDAAANEECAFD